MCPAILAVQRNSGLPITPAEPNRIKSGCFNRDNVQKVAEFMQNSSLAGGLGILAKPIASMVLARRERRKIGIEIKNFPLELMGACGRLLLKQATRSKRV